MTLSSISAAVLIGGHSRRMGTPKALIRLTDGGDSLIERTVATLQSITEHVTLVGNPEWPLPPAVANYRLVPDRGISAADGIVTALDAAEHRFSIVVACDMPFTDAALLRELSEVALRDQRGVLVADRHGIHPLHAVWDSEQLATIQTAVERGERSLSALAQWAAMATVRLDAPDRSSQERWSVFNINTPDDLLTARAFAAEME